jgi:NitT/TauT family transport system substrate-binding protein
MFKQSSLALLGCALISTAAFAQDTKLTIGMSGWTGFAPLTLADKAGIFKKFGLDVEIKMIPQKDRHLALASNSIQCAATTVETHVAWNTNGVPIVQIFQLDKSFGADGLAVRGDIKSIADLKGKTIGVDAPGTAPYFGLNWILRKNGMTIKDVKTVTLSPQASAQAFVTGQNDAAMTYEPYLSTIREKPESGKIIATTLDYPMVMDTFGCAPAWLKANPKAARGLADAYFAALDMLKAEPAKANEIMGSGVKQTGEQFAKSAAFLRWQDRAANQKFFAGELQAFMKEASVILLESGVVKTAPTNFDSMIDASFIK